MTERIAFETFREIDSYEQGQLTASKPFCHNYLSVRKYRVTIELVEEPIEIIQERIRELWKANSNNYHYVSMILSAAREYGIELEKK